MPAMFIHGVPETAGLWDDLRARLRSDDSMVLRLPGFGTERPDGFAATKDAYVDWIIREIEAVGAPVDLVGHDWGGGFTVRVASLRSDLLRSWASDALYVYDDDYEWHQFAKLWQTPEAGEAWVEQQAATPASERAPQLQAVGVPEGHAERVAGWFDATMGGAILDLYRSATRVAADWGADVQAITAPGLALRPTADPFADATFVERMAARAGVPVTTLDGRGHWWMLEDPAEAADVLESFWASAG